jgi:hypothetical protein
MSKLSEKPCHLGKDDQKAIRDFLNLGGDISDLLSRKFSLDKSRKLKLNLAKQEISELKATLAMIENKTRTNTANQEVYEQGMKEVQNLRDSL